MNPFSSTTHNPISDSFHLCFPKDSKEAPARVCFFVNKKIDQTSWRFIDHSRDLCTLEIGKEDPSTGEAKKIAIHNVYNPPRTTENRRSCLPGLKVALTKTAENDQIALGDFNLHHEYWAGEPVRATDPEADNLIDIIQEH